MPKVALRVYSWSTNALLREIQDASASSSLSAACPSWTDSRQHARSGRVLTQWAYPRTCNQELLRWLHWLSISMPRRPKTAASTKLFTSQCQYISLLKCYWSCSLSARCQTTWWVCLSFLSNDSWGIITAVYKFLAIWWIPSKKFKIINIKQPAIHSRQSEYFIFTNE